LAGELVQVDNIVRPHRGNVDCHPSLVGEGRQDGRRRPRNSVLETSAW
jgi:hypothetical protein